MPKTYYYLVNFEAVCEECGKRFRGVISKEVPVNDSALAGDILNSAADSFDAGVRKKAVESAVRDKRWSDLDLHYGLDGHSCPHCGARQSWDPMPKPEEPKRTAKGKAGTIVGYLLGAFILGGVVALVEYLIQSFAFHENDPTFTLIIWMACLIVGVVLGVRSNKRDDVKAGATFPERMREYERQLAEYNDYQAKVAARPKRNEPLVTLSSGRFTSALDASFAQAGLDWRDF